MSPSILLVDDDPISIKLMARILGGIATVRSAANGQDALRLARESPPDLVLLDAELPGLSGFQVCQALKADEALTEVPVIFVTSHAGSAFEMAGFQIGAADFIAKPVNAHLMLARVNAQLRVKRMADDLRRISTIDALTGVFNRRRFEESLEREWLCARRNGDGLALLMVDVDHFKLFNDRYGHPHGDTCLRSVAQALVTVVLRPADLVARYGGEEFTLLLPQTATHGAEQVAHRVLDAITALNITHASSPTAPHITVSIGIGCYHETHNGAAGESSADGRSVGELQDLCAARDLLHAADKALYAAKHAGRARARLLSVAPGETTPTAARVHGNEQQPNLAPKSLSTLHL